MGLPKAGTLRKSAPNLLLVADVPTSNSAGCPAEKDKNSGLCFHPNYLRLQFYFAATI